MDLESHLLRLSIALLKIDNHDIILNFILNSNYLSHRLEAGGTGVNSGLDVPLLGGDGHGLAEVAVHIQSLVRGPDRGPLGALSLGPWLIHGLGIPLVHGLGFFVVFLEVILEHLGLGPKLLESASLSLWEGGDLLWLRPQLLGSRGSEAPVLGGGALPPL